MKKEEKMVNQEQIKEWKTQHGSIYKTSIGDSDLTFIWRKLKRQEYLDLMKEGEDVLEDNDKLFIRQDKMVEAVVLYPENIKEVIQQNAGVSTTLSDEILAKSGFDMATTKEL